MAWHIEGSCRALTTTLKSNGPPPPPRWIAASTALERALAEADALGVRETGARSRRVAAYGLEQRGWTCKEHFAAVSMASAKLDGRWCVEGTPVKYAHV